jgi:excisionase family DNA binding protein
MVTLAEQPRLLLDVQETCSALRISRTALYDLTRAGSLTPIKIGRSVRFPLAELERFVRERAEGDNRDD